MFSTQGVIYDIVNDRVKTATRQNDNEFQNAAAAIVNEAGGCRWGNYLYATL